MNRRSALGALLALSACGGGGDSAAPIDLLGDSLASSLLQVPPAPYERLPRTVAMLLAEFTGRKVNDYSVPGADFGKAIRGELAFGKLESHVQRTEADTIVCWYGGAPALFDVPIGQIEAETRQGARIVQEAGKRLVLAGYYDHAHPPYHAALVPLRDMLRRVACDLKCSCVDFWDIPIVFGDPVHWDQDTAIHGTRKVADEILNPKGAKSCSS